MSATTRRTLTGRTSIAVCRYCDAPMLWARDARDSRWAPLVVEQLDDDTAGHLAGCGHIVYARRGSVCHRVANEQSPFLAANTSEDVADSYTLHARHECP